MPITTMWEPPGTGDPYRYLYLTPPNPRLKENYTWQLTNRNKRSLAVDLKNPQAGAPKSDSTVVAAGPAMKLAKSPTVGW